MKRGTLQIGANCFAPTFQNPHPPTQASCGSNSMNSSVIFKDQIEDHKILQKATVHWQVPEIRGKCKEEDLEFKHNTYGIRIVHDVQYN
ncbi:hypothetical protein EUGRSUZ_L02737 [Eucalyptus grandis]|uniref:Uncharacterized protein n=1 Tax=Eucalyptus grandis TaxID=71139 RepID=A0AAD9T8J8_EUCGR|nr:hypothetical protein EUGRSUZ_L02737 [Eucalyptus grandis]